MGTGMIIAFLLSLLMFYLDRIPKKLPRWAIIACIIMILIPFIGVPILSIHIYEEYMRGGKMRNIFPKWNTSYKKLGTWLSKPLRK